MNNGGNAAIVKVYQLKGNSNFRKVPVSAFWRSDAKALGGALLTEPREVTLYPSDSTTVQIKLVDKAKYVGVAANLRDPRREKWRFSHSVKDMGDQVWLTVKNREIAVRVEDKGLLDRIAGLF
jgi:type VI secretion system VasD/TssJ family lipoprotein